MKVYIYWHHIIALIISLCQNMGVQNVILSWGLYFLLQTGSTDISLPDTSQIRAECRCATCSSFLPCACFSYKGHEIIIFWIFLIGTTLWWLLQNCSAFVSGAGHVRGKCGCVKNTLFWPWPSITYVQVHQVLLNSALKIWDSYY